VVYNNNTSSTRCLQEHTLPWWLTQSITQWDLYSLEVRTWSRFLPAIQKCVCSSLDGVGCMVVLPTASFLRNTNVWTHYSITEKGKWSFYLFLWQKTSKYLIIKRYSLKEYLILHQLSIFGCDTFINYWKPEVCCICFRLKLAENVFLLKLNAEPNLSSWRKKGKDVRIHR